MVRLAFVFTLSYLSCLLTSLHQARLVLSPPQENRILRDRLANCVARPFLGLDSGWDTKGPPTPPSLGTSCRQLARAIFRGRVTSPPFPLSLTSQVRASVAFSRFVLRCLDLGSFLVVPCSVSELPFAHLAPA